MTDLAFSEAEYHATKRRPQSFGDRTQIQHVVGRKVNQERLRAVHHISRQPMKEKSKSDLGLGNLKIIREFCHIFRPSFNACHEKTRYHFILKEAIQRFIYLIPARGHTSGATNGQRALRPEGGERAPRTRRTAMDR
jgi:hypothetical protein